MGDLSLLASMAIVLGVALVGGMAARLLKLPVILGYLLSGIVIGPYGLKLVSEVGDVETLAEIGVVLLMFTLGIEFSLKTLRQIGKIAVFGGAAQIVATVALGLMVGWLLQWSLTEAVVFGFFIALSSTIIVLKTLMDRGELGSPHGRVMIGILLVQDLSVVPMMVILTSLGDTGTALWGALGWAVLKAVLFLGVIFALGYWVLPRVMRRVVGGRSRELFLLTGQIGETLRFLGGRLLDLLRRGVGVVNDAPPVCRRLDVQAGDLVADHLAQIWLRRSRQFLIGF